MFPKEMKTADCEDSTCKERGIDGWMLDLVREDRKRGGEKQGTDCAEPFRCASSHLQVSQRGEWVSD